MRIELHDVKVLITIDLLLFALVVFDGCRRHDEEESLAQGDVEAGQAVEQQSATAKKEIPRFAANSPFVRDYNLPGEKEEKRLWAQSFLWEKAPEFVVEQWLTPEPDVKGRYLLVEYWATWCPPCRRSIPVLNEIHSRFGEQLTVVGISDEPKDAVLALEEPKIEYHLAIDTQARMKKALGIVGIPHAIIVEPRGHVVWEGYPLLEGHELTLEVVERILNAGRTGSGL
ncbi:MAG: TlpA family protein disulfide reductase [Phycisphaerales bacterium]|nr:MAG: TlpA family protein disulfide reductase [Phycisphaerales bacterium]